MEIYVPDEWFQEISIQPGYYEKVQDVIDTLLKAGPAKRLMLLYHVMILLRQSL